MTGNRHRWRPPQCSDKVAVFLVLLAFGYEFASGAPSTDRSDFVDKASENFFSLLFAPFGSDRERGQQSNSFVHFFNFGSSPGKNTRETQRGRDDIYGSASTGRQGNYRARPYRTSRHENPGRQGSYVSHSPPHHGRRPIAHDSYPISHHHHHGSQEPPHNHHYEEASNITDSYPGYTDTYVDHHHIEPETHHYPEVDHYPVVEHYHHPPKPKKLHLSFKPPVPDVKVVDSTFRLPQVKFRLHLNPRITITSNTRDPLEKKNHTHEHDYEPYPPDHVFSEIGPPGVTHQVTSHYPKPHEHHHHGYGHDHVYDAHGLGYDHHPHHAHHRSSHYEPTFKIRSNPIIYTDPPPPPRTTTTTTRSPTTRRTTTTTRRPTTTTRRSTTRRTTTRRTTTTAATTTTTTTTTRRPETTRRPPRSSQQGDLGRSPNYTFPFPQNNVPDGTQRVDQTPSGTTATREREDTSSTSSISIQREDSSSTTRTSPTTTTLSTTAAPSTTTIATTPTKDDNEIDMNKTTTQVRKRLEPLSSESPKTLESLTEDENFPVKIIETSTVIDGKNQTVRFYYITQPMRVPLDLLKQLSGKVPKLES